VKEDLKAGRLRRAGAIQPIEMLVDHSVVIEDEVATEIVPFQCLTKPKTIVGPHFVKRQSMQIEPKGCCFGGLRWSS